MSAINLPNMAHLQHLTPFREPQSVRYQSLSLALVQYFFAASQNLESYQSFVRLPCLGDHAFSANDRVETLLQGSIVELDSRGLFSDLHRISQQPIRPAEIGRLPLEYHVHIDCVSVCPQSTFP